MLIGSSANLRIAAQIQRNAFASSSSRSLALLHSPARAFGSPFAAENTARKPYKSTIASSAARAFASKQLTDTCITTAAMDHTHASKRKASHTPKNDRPMKQVRQDELLPPPPMAVNGVSADVSANDTPNDYASSDNEEVEELVHAATTESAEWQATIEKVVKNVVSIHFCQTASFDTDSALSSEATGFVVDAKRGYILTNRHVVGAGPFWGYCIFDNHEECDVYPVYRDPVHDFGILRFDPKAVKYMALDQLSTLR